MVKEENNAQLFGWNSGYYLRVVELVPKEVSKLQYVYELNRRRKSISYICIV